MKRFLLACLASAMLTGVAVAVDVSPAAAYCLAPSGWSTSKWSGTPRVTLWQTSSVPNGYLDDLQASSSAWNGISGSAWSVGTVATNWQGPVVHSGRWYMNSSGPAGGYGGAPGITSLSTLSTKGGTISWANIYLDSSWHWNTSGTMNQSAKQVDVRTVATHELGHLLMLHHPWACHSSMSSAEKSSVMNVTWTKKWAINSDDKAGAAALY